jgi:hypothetical protein
MKLLHEYSITCQFAAVKYISEFNKFMEQLTWGGRSGPTTIYIHTEGMSNILMNTVKAKFFSHG